MKKQNNLWVWFFTALVLLVVTINLFAAREAGVVQSELTYSGFKDLVAAGNVESVVVEGDRGVEPPESRMPPRLVVSVGRDDLR